MQLKPLLKNGLVGLVVVIAVCSLSVNVVQHRKIKALNADPQVLATQENEMLVTAVGRLMVLPDEQPTIATVTDPSKLQGQPFFANAKVGDKVLMYTLAKFAVLYDPVADKIVEKAPLVANADTAAGTEPVEETDEEETAPTSGRRP